MRQNMTPKERAELEKEKQELQALAPRQLVKDVGMAPRTARDVSAMAAAIRLHANNGQALLTSAQFTSALHDVTAYIKQNCHPSE